MPSEGDVNWATEVVFDPSLGMHGGTRYRGIDGRFVSNPNKVESWYCQKSPTGAHHWIIAVDRGRCKYCNAFQDLPEPVTTIPRKRSQEP